MVTFLGVARMVDATAMMGVLANDLCDREYVRDDDFDDDDDDDDD